MVKGHLEGMRRTIAVVVLPACMIGLLVQGCQGPMQSTRIACGLCEGQDRMVRLQPRDTRSGEKKPQFTHPMTLSPEDWSFILRSIHVQKQDQMFLFFPTKGSVEPAFTDDEVGYLSATLSRVFAQAQPEEWVVFALSRHRTSDITEITSGAWFVSGQYLHLVLANYRYAATMPTVRERIWQDPLRPDSAPPYDLVAGEYQTVGEEDAPDSRLFSLTFPSLSIAYKQLLLGGPSSSPATRSTRAGSDASSLPGRTSASNLSLEEQFQMLKRLKDQNLITDEEFRTKKKQLLDQF